MGKFYLDTTQNIRDIGEFLSYRIYSRRLKISEPNDSMIQVMHFKRLNKSFDNQKVGPCNFLSKVSNLCPDLRKHQLCNPFGATVSLRCVNMEVPVGDYNSRRFVSDKRS